MSKFSFKSFLVGLSLSVIFLVSFLGGAVADRLFGVKPLDLFIHRSGLEAGISVGQKVVNEESVVIDVVDKVSPSVVTVSIKIPAKKVLEFSPFGGGITQRIQESTPQDIGSGFIVSSDGLVITNKHVVESEGTYQVITQDGTEYEVKQINKDPSNDIAILKIDANNLKPIEIGDSTNLKVGQYVVAIGTALGEFRQTVTTGVISGLGRGITAGSAYEGYVERLDDVIQTDAAINPGNSGGPLLNSLGQVIGVNVAVAGGAQNIGFAIPINIIKQGLDQFNSTGKFASKPYLGVEYQMISQRAAILNDVPEGAYVLNVVNGSPAANSGIQADDVITKFDGNELTDEAGKDLAARISEKKPGDKVQVTVWRNNEIKVLDVTLSEFSE
jgi:serine protease Do